jgi:hypothetical protein
MGDMERDILVRLSRIEEMIEKLSTDIEKLLEPECICGNGETVRADCPVHGIYF